MVSHSDVAEAFSHHEIKEGSRMFSEGEAVYSYSYHFPIAYWISKNAVLFNTDKYSSSTSTHQSYVMNKLSGIEIIKCNTEEIKKAINNPDKPIIITKYRDHTTIEGLLEEIKRFCNTHGMKRFPLKKFKEQLENKMFMSKL